jgi:hypothetical protein
MKLVRLEIKKIVASYAILGFIVLCFLFNALLISTNGRDAYANYVGGRRSNYRSPFRKWI